MEIELFQTGFRTEWSETLDQFEQRANPEQEIEKKNIHPGEAPTQCLVTVMWIVNNGD